MIQMSGGVDGHAQEYPTDRISARDNAGSPPAQCGMGRGDAFQIGGKKVRRRVSRAPDPTQAAGVEPSPLTFLRQG